MVYISNNGRYLKIAYTNNINYVLSWQFKGLSDLEISSIKTNNYLLNPRIDQYDTSKIRIRFDRSFLNRFPPSILHGKIVNIYIVYEMTHFYDIDNYPTLTNALFGCVKLTKIAHIDKYKYSGYGIGFDGKGYYSIGNELGRNVVIFGLNMDSSSFSDNKKKKKNLILLKGPTQGLGEQSLAAEKMYSINFTKVNTKFCLSLLYNRANSYLFVNGTEIIKSKAKNSMIIPYSLCLGNVSKDFSASNMKKTGFNGYVYDFSTGYSAIDVDNIKDIRKYLMKKNGIV